MSERVKRGKPTRDSWAGAPTHFMAVRVPSGRVWHLFAWIKPPPRLGSRRVTLACSGKDEFKASTKLWYSTLKDENNYFARGPCKACLKLYGKI